MAKINYVLGKGKKDGKDGSDNMSWEDYVDEGTENAGNREDPESFFDDGAEDPGREEEPESYYDDEEIEEPEFYYDGEEIEEPETGEEPEPCYYGEEIEEPGTGEEAKPYYFDDEEDSGREEEPESYYDDEEIEEPETEEESKPYYFDDEEDPGREEEPESYYDGEEIEEPGTGEEPEPYYFDEEIENNGNERRETGNPEGNEAGIINPESPEEDPGCFHEESSKRNFFFLIGNKLAHMKIRDRLILLAGIFLLAAAFILGNLFFHVREAKMQMEEFASVGSSLADIVLPGEAGLLAVADMEASRKAAAEALEEEQRRREEEERRKEEEKTDYEEEEYNKAIPVSMNLSSIEKDLKIKFQNKSSGKLISNIPFSVAVKGADKKSEVWTDEDMDGIIYQINLEPGTYSVQLQALEQERYRNYQLPSSAQSVEVKKDIEYKKVDVSDEVKTEADVDVSKEDTQKHDTPPEKVPDDTVGWVESTEIPVGYKEIEKSDIVDPMTLVSMVNFQRISKGMGGAEIFTADPTEPGFLSILEPQASLESPAEGTEPFSTEEPATDPSSMDSPVTESPSTEDPATDSPSTEDPATEPSSMDPPAPSETVPEKPADAFAFMNVDSVSLGVGESYTFSVTGNNMTLSEIAWSSSDTAVTVVDNAGKVTGVAQGTAEITCTAIGTVTAADGGAESYPVSCTSAVQVVGIRQVLLDKTAVTVYTGTSATIYVTTINAGASSAVVAESSDAGIATVFLEGNALTVTGIAAGSAVVTVHFQENDAVYSAACTVTVKIDPRTDQESRLKDIAGNQVYVLADNIYREAVYADYYTSDHFFIKGDVKYTGWQSFDGKVYYYNADGERVTGEQIIEGARYRFDSDGALMTDNGTRGIDVSKWNGVIDWQAVKNSGIDYVIIRSGYRGSSKGVLVEDPKYKANIQGAASAGLKVGVYFFTQAISTGEAVEEASMVLEQVKNYKLSFPIFLDVEGSGGRADGIDKGLRTEICRAFCQTIQNAGYTAGIYANKTWLTEKIDAGSLGAYKIWLAQYAPEPTYTGKYDMWQYQSTGRVSGINGDVDMNWSYMGY